MVWYKSPATKFGSIRLKMKLINVSNVAAHGIKPLSVCLSPLSLSPPVCLSLVLLAPGLSHMVEWSSRGVEAGSVGEAQELQRVAAGAEISLSGPGRTQTHLALPFLSPSSLPTSSPLPLTSIQARLGHRVHRVHRLTSPLSHQHGWTDRWGGG